MEREIKKCILCKTIWKFCFSQTFAPILFLRLHVAAVSCSPTGARLGGVNLVLGLMGKLGRPRMGQCMDGAWVVTGGGVCDVDNV